MTEPNLFAQLVKDAVPKSEGSETGFFLATVATADSGGITFIPDGQNTATQKKYKMVAAGPLPSAGDRVVVMRLSGSCLVLGVIGMPEAAGEYVEKAGDTMTGSLILRSTTLEADTPPAQSAAGTLLRFNDKNDMRIAALQPCFYADGSVGFELIAARELNGARTENFVKMTVAADGTCDVYLSHPTEWVAALGLDLDTYTETISDICTSSSDFTVTVAKYVQRGKVASIFIKGTWTRTTSSSGWITVLTLKSGKRPMFESAARAWLNTNAYIYANGNLYFYGTITQNNEATFTATYLLA